MSEPVTELKMPAPVRRRSIKFAVSACIAGVLGSTCISPGILSMAALKLGAGEFYLGLLSFAVMGPVCFSVLTMSTIEHHGKRPILLLWYSVAGLCIAPLILMPWLTQSWSAGACLLLMVITVLMVNASGALAFTGWFPILQDIIPPRLTGRFFGNLRSLWQGASLLLMLSIAAFLGSRSHWWKFQIIFLAALLAFAVRSLCIIPMAEKPPVNHQRSRSSLLAIFADFFSRRSERRLLAYLFAYAVAFSISEPFKIKLLKDMGYSEGFILAALAMINLGAMLSLRIWGRLADRFGNRFIFGISHIAMTVTTLAWILVNKSPWGGVLVFALYLLGSLFNSGNGIAQTRYILHSIPPQKQNHITIANIAVFATWGIAPVIGAGILKLTEHIHWTTGPLAIDNYDLLFITNAALFMVPHRLRLLLGLKKDTPTAHVLVLRPLTALFGPFARYGNADAPPSTLDQKLDR